MAVASVAACETAASDYWRQSARPLVSLCFVAPLLVVYEGGTVLLGPAAIRGGADLWLRELLAAAGFGQYFLLPALTCGLLLAWHHARQDPWQAGTRRLAPMWLEAILWGGALLVAGRGILALVAFGPAAAPQAAAALPAGPLAASAARVIGYVGAGLYEELLFRLLLLPLVAMALRGAGWNRRMSLLAAAMLTSLLFAAAHYRWEATLLGVRWVWPYGESFAPLSFSLRAGAGAALATIFVARGFGIAVGAHAAYDVLVLVTA